MRTFARSLRIVAVVGILVFGMLSAAGGGVTLAASPGPNFDLTGIWKCSDGGTYYIRQVGNEVWWYGKGGNFGNVFHGQFNVWKDEPITGFQGHWADVPTGSTNGSGAIG